MDPVQLVLFLGVALAAAWVLAVGYRRLRVRDQADDAHRRGLEVADQRTEGALDTIGFSPDNPIVVESAAAIEPRATALPCPLCGGTLHVEAHEAPPALAGTLRVLEMKCGQCGERQQLFARVETPTAPN